MVCGSMALGVLAVLAAVSTSQVQRVRALRHPVQIDADQLRQANDNAELRGSAYPRRSRSSLRVLVQARSAVQQPDVARRATGSFVNSSNQGHPGEIHASAAHQPRLFFLFLTRSSVGNGDLWQAFFDGIDKRLYSSFVHCQDEVHCDANSVSASKVSSVPTVYCDDLVSAMVQLLRAATKDSSSPNDKFIFLSDTTLPLKPFAGVYSALTSNRNSDFCVSPRSEWLSLALGHKRALLVTHSQWVVLSKDHAAAMVDRWPRIKAGHSKKWGWAIPVWPGGRRPSRPAANDSIRMPTDVPSCTDEWAVFATIYGLIADDGQQLVANLPNFGSGSLWLAGAKASNTFQGGCRTFASWGNDQSAPGSAEGKLLQELVQDWPHSKLICTGLFFQNNHLVKESNSLPCNDTHPAEFAALSDRGVVALRRSPFLFARKFQRLAMSPQQFRSIIMSSMAS